MTDDPLAKWRRPGDQPVARNELGDGAAVASASALRRREYKAFVSDAARVPMLVLKHGLMKKPETDKAFPYACISKVISDGYGFFFSLSFRLPSGKVVVEFSGEGMRPVLDAIVRGTAAEIQVFDPDRFLAPKEGEFDIEADEWQGAAVVRDIGITDKLSPEENTTKH